MADPNEKISVRNDSEDRKRKSLDQAKDLDLDAFYYSRLRRRTQFAQQISNTLTAAGVPTDAAAAGAAEAASPSKKRGIGMTLSPGEEYENYQKVQATMMGNDGLFVTDVVHQEEDEEDEEEDEKNASTHDKVSPLNRPKDEAFKREELRKAAGITIKKPPSPQHAALHTERTIGGKEDLSRPQPNDRPPWSLSPLLGSHEHQLHFLQCYRFTALPYGYIFTEDGNYSATLRKSVKLLRLIRLLRLLRISRILRRIQNAIFIRSTLSSLMKYCLMVIFINHWFSCIFHAIGSSNIEQSWIKAQGLEIRWRTRDRYVAALYFSVQTLSTIGFGDVASQSAHERLFCVFAMIVGGGIFAYGITNYFCSDCGTRLKPDDPGDRFSSKLDEVNEYMSARELPVKLRMEIREFYHNTRQSRESEIGHEMFFIFRGAVEVVKKNVRVGILGENQYFGEMAILSPDNRRTATVRTLCFCELRMLSRARFLEALALFPAMQAKMAQIAQGRAAAVNFDPINEKHKQKSAHFSGNNLMTAAAAFSLSPSSLNSEQKSFAAPKPHVVTSAAVAPTPTLAPAPAPKSPSFARHLSAARLPLEQRPSERLTTHIRTPTSVRINSNVRRSSGNAGAVGISPVMSIMIGEITSLLEESTRRQDLLVTQVLKLKEDLDRIRMPVTDMNDRKNTNGDLADIFENNNK
ncbi:Cyclic nucleotide-binding-like [Phytophthora cactorum]|nr:Cyclic nucleotide-binding-like [Phytophthora cactorum]